MTLSSYIKRRMFGLRWRWERLNNVFYDWRHGVETHQECFLNAQGVTEEQAQQGNNVYRPFWRKEFFDAIETLDIDLKEYDFIDIGAGKGKLLLLASHFPFSKIIGIEYAPSLHAVAVKNIQKLKAKTGLPRTIECIRADALTWGLPHRPAVYFLYNPFDFTTTKAFFLKLDEHAAKTRLPTLLIYANLRGVGERQAAFASGQSLFPKTTTPRYVVYQNQVVA